MSNKKQEPKAEDILQAANAQIFATDVNDLDDEQARAHLDELSNISNFMRARRLALYARLKKDAGHAIFDIRNFCPMSG